jgi:hypothetical protein
MLEVSCNTFGRQNRPMKIKRGITHFLTHFFSLFNTLTSPFNTFLSLTSPPDDTCIRHHLDLGLNRMAEIWPKYGHYLFLA